MCNPNEGKGAKKSHYYCCDFCQSQVPGIFNPAYIYGYLI